jgi:membrane-associated phospholipid phosphatase
MRGVGVLPALSDLSTVVVALVAVVTQLGDAWFLFVLLTLVYWFGEGRLAPDHRRVGALVVGVTVGGLALTLALKTAFALPRPPGASVTTVPPWLPPALGAAYVDAATGTGFGFPSGHALGSTVAYGGFALLGTWATRRGRWATAGALVLLVAASRVVLGVHYLVDVVAGVGVGLTFLWAAARFADGDPTRAFGLAAVVSVLAVVVAGVGDVPSEALVESVSVLGASVGGLVGWRLADQTSGPPGPLGAGVGLSLAGGLWVGVTAVTLPHLGTFLATAAAVALVLVVPTAAARLER